MQQDCRHVAAVLLTGGGSPGAARRLPQLLVYRLVATGTIGEKVVALLQRRRDLFPRVVDDGALTSTALTADGSRGLFT